MHAAPGTTAMRASATERTRASPSAMRSAALTMTMAGKAEKVVNLSGVVLGKE